MPQRVWAIDDLIVNDETNLRSTLVGGVGLPAAQAKLAERYGRWPLVSGLGRPAQRLSLTTVFERLSENDRRTTRRLLLQVLNPELETTCRLLVADEIIQGVATDGVLLALGPWDVYCDDDGAWQVRDLLQPEDVEADLSGGWQIGLDGGLQVAEAQTNDCAYPRMKDTDSDGEAEGWTFGNGPGVTGSPTYTVVDHDVSVRGWYQRIQYTGMIGDADDGTAFIQGYFRTAAASYGAGDDCTLSIDCKGSATGVGVRIYLRAENAANGNLGQQYTEITLTSSQQRISVTYENLPATTDHVWVVFYIMNIGNGDEIDAYFGAANVEDMPYDTPFIAGNLGPGHSWSGTEDASTSSRTAAACNLDDHVDLISGNEMLTFHLRFIAEYDADEDWPDEAILFDARGSSDNDRAYVEFEDSDDKFHVYVNGADRFQSSAQTFERGDEVDLILTLDFENDSYVLYVDGAADGSDTTSLSAPTLTAWRLGSDYNGANQANCAYLVYQVFDHVVSAAEAALMATQDLNARWLNVLCEAAQPWAPDGIPTDLGIVSTLAIDDDVRWRSRDGDVAFWRIYDETADLTVDVDSDDDVHPIFRTTPKTAKTSGFLHKRWVPIVWDEDAEAATGHGTLIGPLDLSGEAQADGDDIRVYVDGIERDRWLAGTLVSAVKVWFNADFDVAVTATLAEDIGEGDTVSEITVSTDISDVPIESILLIDSEAFYYTGRNSHTKTFTGVTRAIRGTSAAAHSSGATVYWIQHDVWLYYGDSTLSAPSVDDDYKPAFDLDDSSNSVHCYEEFGEDDGLRAAQWVHLIDSGTPYTADHNTNADPWEEIGWRLPGADLWNHWYLYSPCGISQANFQNGEKQYYSSAESHISTWTGAVHSSADGTSWNLEYVIPDPTADDTWEPWSRDETLDAGARYVALSLQCTSHYNADIHYVECANVDITLTNPPTVSAGDEQNAYELDCTITNGTTGEAITLTASMLIDQVLIVDTDEKTVKFDDGTRFFTALEPDGVRRDWLRLVPGENDLSFSESGAQEVEIDILWDRRYFE